MIKYEVYGRTVVAKFCEEDIYGNIFPITGNYIGDILANISAKSGLFYV